MFVRTVSLGDPPCSWIATATSRSGAVTRHLVREETGFAAYRRLRPLLSPGSHIDTMSLEHWRNTRGRTPPGPPATRPSDPCRTGRRVRETHLRIAPGGTEDLFVDIATGDERGGDPTPYNIKLGLEWSHEQPFPDGWLFGRMHRRIAKSTEELEALRLAARPTS